MAARPGRPAELVLGEGQMVRSAYAVYRLAAQVSRDLECLNGLYVRVVGGDRFLGEALVRLEESITVKEIFMAAARRDLELEIPSL